ncbi:MAG: pantoate--beta-alanine ligase, partial [Myxococcota bacterium]
MISISTERELRHAVAKWRAEGERIGFVPTMGALHAGHLSLVGLARQQASRVVVSIFVNPTQFGPREDLTAYPRPLEADLAICEADGVDLVFHPDARDVYPDAPRTAVRVAGLTEPMEGASRPGHFDGVALVCAKLFNIVGPCTAYFGEKDAQQLRVVRRMVLDLDFPVEVVSCPTVRDHDGLAMSSRNAYLSGEERGRALGLPRALQVVAQLVEAGERRTELLERIARKGLGEVDAVDYVAFVHPETLEPVTEVEGPVLVCAAVRVGATRL